MVTHPISKTLYMPNVSGHAIVEKQDELNTNPNTWVKATQIFPLVGVDGGPVFAKRGDKLYRAYDSFIYYGEKISEESNTETNNEIIEDEAGSNIDIVIPN